MKLTLDDVEYESRLIDMFTMSIGEARTIKRQTGLTVGDYHDGLKTLDRLDPDIFLSMVFLLKSRAGETVDWDVLNELPLMAVMQGLDFALSDQDRADLAKAADDSAKAAVAEAESITAKSANKPNGTSKQRKEKDPPDTP